MSAEIKAALDVGTGACFLPNGAALGDTPSVTERRHFARGLAAFLLHVANNHASFFGTMEPREAMKRLAAAVEAAND